MQSGPSRTRFSRLKSRGFRWSKVAVGVRSGRCNGGVKTSLPIDPDYTALLRLAHSIVSCCVGSRPANALAAHQIGHLGALRAAASEKIDSTYGDSLTDILPLDVGADCELVFDVESLLFFVAVTGLAKPTQQTILQITANDILESVLSHIEAHQRVFPSHKHTYLVRAGPLERHRWDVAAWLKQRREAAEAGDRR
jgi:hypothetical protein